MHLSKNIRFLSIITLCAFITILFCSTKLYSQDDEVPTRNQTKVTLKTKFLNEERTLWIYTPNDYATSDEKYPVLYLLDPGFNFAYVTELERFLSDRYRIPKLIVVGILNRDRIRDFTPIHSLIYDGHVDSSLMSTGSGTKFLTYVKNEIIRYVDSNYRTAPYRILEGHSLGGLFALYCKEQEPNLFQSEIIISPAFYGGNLKILSQFKPFLQLHPELNGVMSLSLGKPENEPAGRSTVDSLIKQLKTSAPKTFRWQFTSYMNEDHFSVGYKSMYDGLRFIYSDWFMSPEDSVSIKTYKDIERHYSLLSKQFGYKIIPGQEFMDDCGYEKLNKGHTKEAIEIFQQNINNHPNSSSAYNSIADAYSKNGDDEPAIKNYEKSLSLNSNNDHAVEMLKKLKATKNN